MKIIPKDITEKEFNDPRIVVTVLNDTMKKGRVNYRRWSDQEFLEKVSKLFPGETPYRTIYTKGDLIAGVKFELPWKKEELFNVLRSNIVAAKYVMESNNFKIIPLGKGLFNNNGKEWFLDMDALETIYDKKRFIMDSCWEMYLKIGGSIEVFIDDTVDGMIGQHGLSGRDDLKDKVVEEFCRIITRWNSSGDK